MRIYLDDERKTPTGWERMYTAWDVIKALRTGQVTEISLDHDLGDDEKYGTGYDVLCWIEEQVFVNKITPPKINIHSANTSAVSKMKKARSCIKKIHNMNKLSQGD